MAAASSQQRTGPRTSAESDQWVSRFWDLLNKAGRETLLSKNLQGGIALTSDYSGRACCEKLLLRVSPFLRRAGDTHAKLMESVV